MLAYLFCYYSLILLNLLDLIAINIFSTILNFLKTTRVPHPAILVLQE